MKRCIFYTSRINALKGTAPATLSQRRLAVLSACVFALGTASVFGVRAYTPKVPMSAGHAAQHTLGSPRLTDSLLITITPGGFDRDQITAPAVPFFILVENRSGLDEVSLQLDRVAGPRLRQVTVPQERLDWSDLVDLSPGEYVLSEANHPSWICRITITSK